MRAVIDGFLGGSGEDSGIVRNFKNSAIFFGTRFVPTRRDGQILSEVIEPFAAFAELFQNGEKLDRMNGRQQRSCRGAAENLRDIGESLIIKMQNTVGMAVDVPFAVTVFFAF